MAASPLPTMPAVGSGPADWPKPEVEQQGAAIGAQAYSAEPMVLADDFRISKDFFMLAPQYKDYVEDVLLPYGMIKDRVQKLASDILNDYAGSTVHLLCILKGGHQLFSDLTESMREQHTMRGNIRAAAVPMVPFTFDFARVKSYDGDKSKGYLEEIMLDLKSLAGRDVLLVEDVVDTGTTMALLLPKIQAVARSVRIVSLLEKRTSKSNGLRAHYVGFSIPDHFVVGYNLDFDGAFRELEHVCIINSAGIGKFRHYLKNLSSGGKTGAEAATGGGGTAAAPPKEEL